MIKVKLDDLAASLKLKLERKGFEYIKTRSIKIQQELLDLGKQWLMESRKKLSKTANPYSRSEGEYPRSYKWYRGEGNPNPDKNHYLVDSIFYSIRRRVNPKSVSISIHRGFLDGYNIWSGIDYGKMLNSWQGKPFAGYQERIVDAFDTRVDDLLRARRFM